MATRSPVRVRARLRRQSAVSVTGIRRCSTWKLRLVVGKAIFTCDRPPRTHDATAWLEKRRQGAGAEWTTVDGQQTSRVPRPKEALFLHGTCEFGETAYWRVRVQINGTIRQDDGRIDAFAAEDSSREIRIVCRERR
jgi:hypothetical protein